MARGRGYVRNAGARCAGAPPYGTFHDRDVYRHVYDERGMKLIPFDEDQIVSQLIIFSFKLHWTCCYFFQLCQFDI